MRSAFIFTFNSTNENVSDIYMCLLYMYISRCECVHFIHINIQYGHVIDFFFIGSVNVLKRSPDRCFNLISCLVAAMFMLSLTFFSRFQTLEITLRHINVNQVYYFKLKKCQIKEYKQMRLNICHSNPSIELHEVCAVKIVALIKIFYCLVCLCERAFEWKRAI